MAKKIHRILIVGTGSIGARHARCFIDTNRSQVGICEINEKLRNKVTAEYGISKSFASLEEALKDEWDAAVIATPANTHIPIALQLARAGVHLLIEKPLSTTLDGIEELIGTIGKNNLVVSVAYVYRAHPGVSAMRRATQSGKFGQPVQIVSVCGAHFPFYRPAYRDIYYSDRSRGGGAIQDALTHILNAGEWLVGPIDRLTADAEHKVLDGVEVEDTVNLICRHGDVMGSYSLNQHQAPCETTITVICEKGTLRFELHENRWRWMTEPGGAWHDEAMPPMERNDWYILQGNAFLDALEGKAAPQCTIDEAYQTLRVNLAALASADDNAQWKTI